MPRQPYRNRQRQTTIQFTPLSSSSPAKDAYSPAVQSRLASVRFTGAKSSLSSANHKSQDGETSLPTPEPSSQPAPEENHVHVDLLSSESDEDDLVLPSQKRRRTSYQAFDSPSNSPIGQRSTHLASRRIAETPDKQERTTPEVPTIPLTRRSTRLRTHPPAQNFDPDEIQPKTLVKNQTSIDNDGSSLSELGSPETSDEDDIVLATRPSVTRRRNRSMTEKDPFIVDNDDLQYVSSDTISNSKAKARPKSKKPRNDFIVDDSDEIDYISSDASPPPSTSRQRLRHVAGAKKTKISRKRTRREQDELEDDLQNLQDSDGGENTPTRSRTRGGPVTTKRDSAREHLDLLRRRRAGEKIPRIYDSDEESQSSHGVDLDLIGQPDDNPSDKDGDMAYDEPDQVYPPEDENGEDDFIIDDSVGRLGRSLHDIPLQFTSFASAKPKELFIHIIEWLVKNKIAPAFSRQDDLYNLAFDRVEDQVKAQAGSRLISAAWGAEFKRVILSRPEMKVSLLPGPDEDNIRNCDACNRTNHPARYEFIFSGQPYFKKTLEPVDDSDNETDGEEDSQEHDEHGNPLPSSAQRYYLGRHCAANAQMGHKLTHWKHHLNESLMIYLEEQGVLSSEAIIERERMNKKKREKEAENVVDHMNEIGMIAELWSDFKSNLDSARTGMED